MAKTLKSVKVDNRLLEMIELYTSLMKSIVGGSATFTTIVEEGICLYLQNQAEMLRRLAEQKIVFENGTLKELNISDKQLQEIQRLEAEAFVYRETDELSNADTSTN